jgi:hypothetical protein
VKISRRLAVKFALALVALYLAASAGLYWVMRQPPEVFGRVMKHVPTVAFILLPFKPLWLHARAGHLKVGDAAPDFTLHSSDKKELVQLSSFRGEKPVVLVFGSYT